MKEWTINLKKQGDQMDGWYALALSILKNYNPDTSLSIIETGHRKAKGTPKDEQVPVDMILMREEGQTWAQIGKSFGLSPDNAYRRVQRYNKRKGD